MKTTIKVFCSAIILTAILFSACKKEKKNPPPTPSTPIPNTTVKIALLDYTPYAGTVSSPKIIAQYTSPPGALGDTIAVHTLTSWPTAAAFPANDSIAFATYGDSISATISYPLANDGSYYMLFFYEGAILKETVRIYPNNIVAGAGAGTSPGAHDARVSFRYTPALIVIGW